MTIDSTPSLSEVASEFGGTTPHSLSEYYGSAFSDNSYAPSSGAISLGDFQNKTKYLWSFRQKIMASDAQGYDRFGDDVSLSRYGDYAIVGASREDTGATDAGAAYIFKKSGSSWSQQVMLKANDPQGSDHFGQSVAIDYDGNTAAVGAYMEDTGVADAGSVYIYTRSGTTWSQQQKIQTADRHAQDYFGFDVYLSDDGNTLVASACSDDEGGTDAGAAYIYSRTGTTWTQRLKFTASDAQGYDYFGQSVCVSGDGKTVISGAYYEDTGGTNSGAAYIHDLP